MIASAKGQILTSSFFIAFIVVSLCITYWATRRAKNASGFFVAGRRLSGWQNGLAISGDYMSAASFLGIAGLVSLYGFDGLLYSFGFIVGWVAIVLIVAEPLRNSGKYTISDVMAFRLKARPVRALAAASSIAIGLLYLLAQLVGAGAIASLLLPISPSAAIVVVGLLMVVYVLFGGMVATTYVQIVKAVLVFATTALLAILLLYRFGFSLDALLQAAASSSGKGRAFLEPGLYFTNKLDLISLGLALVLGTAGLPHIMMRFYTVPDAKQARVSANWVIGVVGVYLVMTTVLGFGAAALVGHDRILAANKAGNSAAPLLALELGGGNGTVGGEVLVAFVSAVTFATILAVVAGLIIAATSNIAYDLYSQVIHRGTNDEKSEVRVAKIATLAVGGAAVALALAAQTLNVAFLVGLAFAVAASGNLPVILFSLFWRRFNTTGAVAALSIGLCSALGLVAVGPAFIGPRGLFFHDLHPLLTLTNPGIVSIPLGFIAGWLGTLLGVREAHSESRFRELQIRALTGFGAEVSDHP
ncbi:cation acetate symporter [Beijerinckia sp. L45]|uniref:solute symporter family protein n=1 Tax=Beijerinckia sp. L45 TaxID=1641855 RepID=UPI00131DF165|nr:cation acetate symporter [Beijerinckia sp. L45]